MNTEHNITKETFQNLSFENKLKTIWNKGSFVDSHITSVGESRIINLYKFTKFYVEIVYSEIGTRIKSINFYNPGSKILSYVPATK